ncbi:RNA polymerase sigma-70 factor (family 1) [Pedobacter africanus]|uniref:RNA polymerase sigma-70 factor (ECF subfamily) n=1 Tax=Pedobacter africanus TaxID=151894 RepID=A0ACC6KS92_9SPHI|nr:RNA polymerase sigma-70 factor [Pedobacter africanus]MDR6782199.1 RNA polymerase sigma-70 factor (ECF subfamily) [Pedobacter africanus]
MVTYGGLSDQELVSLLKHGDRLAFTQIYDRYKYLLYAHAFKRLRNDEESEDLIHDLFATLWNRRETFELKSHLQGYLYTAVRNRIFKLLAHKDIESEYISSFQQASEQSSNITDYLVRENQMAMRIEKEIAALPPKMREVFELSRKHNLSHKEIAEQLGISEQTVSRQVTNALKILKTKLGLLVYLVFLIR